MIAEAEKLQEIIVEEKLHITEIEETIEAEIVPLPVEELTDVPEADGKCPIQTSETHENSTSLLVE